MHGEGSRKKTVVPYSVGKQLVKRVAQPVRSSGSAGRSENLETAWQEQGPVHDLGEERQPMF